MTATPAPAIPATVETLAAKEREFEAKYLGDDLDEICAAAYASGDPVFIASAALPLKNRRAAFVHWRKKRVCELLAQPAFQRFLAAAEAELREAITAGETPLAEIKALAADFEEKRAQSLAAARDASKEALRAALIENVKDSSGNEQGPILPGFVAILATGESAIFRRRHAAVEWARAANCRWLFAEIQPEATRIFPGPEVD